MWSQSIAVLNPYEALKANAEKMQDTKKFETVSSDDKIKETLQTIFKALQEKGYNPINQLVGYILSEDPTYITNYNNARSLICKIDRDELLQEMLKNYLQVK